MSIDVVLEEVVERPNGVVSRGFTSSGEVNVAGTIWAHGGTIFTYVDITEGDVSSEVIDGGSSWFTAPSFEATKEQVRDSALAVKGITQVLRSVKATGAPTSSL